MLILFQFTNSFAIIESWISIYLFPELQFTLISNYLFQTKWANFNLPFLRILIYLFSEFQFSIYFFSESQFTLNFKLPFSDKVSKFQFTFSQNFNLPFQIYLFSEFQFTFSEFQFIFEIQLEFWKDTLK